jgi:hypothetical protein
VTHNYGNRYKNVNSCVIRIWSKDAEKKKYDSTLRFAVDEDEHIKQNDIVGYGVYMGTTKKDYRVLDQKSEGRRSNGRLIRHAFEVNLKKIICDAMEWIDLVHYRIQWQTIMKVVTEIRIECKLTDLLT